MRVYFLALFLLIGACSTHPTPPDADTGVIDTGVPDADAEIPDAEVDAAPDVRDVGVPDAMFDARVDANIDAQVDACVDVSLAVDPERTNVVFVIDQSGSMAEPFGTSNRWDALKTTLLADDGIIATYQDNVFFGTSLYTSFGGHAGGVCPVLTEVSPVLNNLSTIRNSYGPANFEGDTPTGEAIDAVRSQVTGLEGNTILILATDGEPDTCDMPNPQQGQQVAVDAVAQTHTEGINTYIIAVADESELSQQHVDDLANAGIGVSSGAPSYRVDNDEGLRAAIEELVFGNISCDVPLEGQISGVDPCDGTVLLGASELECGGADGWDLLGDNSTLRLNGAACDAFRRGAKLDVTFPCKVIVILI